MYTIDKHGMRWWVEDESLLSVLDSDLLSDARRPFWVREYGNGKAFTKLFREKGLIGAIRNWLRPRGRREYETALRLLHQSVPTPRPLGYGKGRMSSASIQEYKEGKDFFALFRESSDRSHLLYTLSSLLQKLKHEGVRHNDLHLRNILVSSDVAYIIDLHKTVTKNRFSRVDELTNLCQALTSVYADLTEDEKVLFFESYGNGEIRVAAEDELARMGVEWAKRKKKRAFRTTSLLSASGSMVSIKGTEGCCNGHFLEYLKQDKKTQVERYSSHLCKRYRNRRRLKKAWRNHVVLEYMALSATPRAYYLQKASAGKRGYIAMEDLGSQGEEFPRFVDDNYDAMSRNGEMKRFVDRFASFLLSLFARQITHVDMKSSNVFVLKDGTFRLLDVEDIRFEVPDKDLLRNAMIQLNNSVPKRLGLGYRLRFFSRVTKDVGLSSRERKALLKSVAEASMKDVIVYVGVSGLVTETWT